jgi:hypothetical protein
MRLFCSLASTTQRKIAIALIDPDVMPAFAKRRASRNFINLEKSGPGKNSFSGRRF